MENEEVKMIRVRIMGKWTQINAYHIIYCEADGDYTWIYMYDKKEPYFAWPWLNAVDKKIDLNWFHRINDDLLANLKFYKRLNTMEGKRDLYLGENVVLTVSVRKLSPLRKKLKMLGLKK
jgi:DNA-binding LytR/AlgR family response regulator